MVIWFVFNIARILLVAIGFWAISKILKKKFENCQFCKQLRVSLLSQIIVAILRAFPIIAIAFMFDGPLRGALFFAYEFYAIYVLVFTSFIGVILTKKLYCKKFNEKLSLGASILSVIVAEIIYYLFSVIASIIVNIFLNLIF